MSAVRATSAATVRTAVARTAVARTAVARTAVARGAALAALVVLVGCVAGIPGALGPGPALTGALLPATGVFGVLHAVRPR
ncbi:hypothetical protein [Actinacidiphila glaucinigra]|uniref:hypothetical protein n=1 Tax=Actinacidiphila glaucinigra TaxID=235986 RepID=UPI0029AC7EB9|nr:hypothetical protein [Streptomyces sp. PA03-3a]